MQIAVYNEAGEQVKIITETTITNMLTNVVLTQSGTGVNAFNPVQGPLTITIPGVSAPDSKGNSVIDPQFNWSGTNDNGQTVANGTYYIRVTVTDANGQSSTISKSVTVLSSEQYVQVNIYNSAGELVQRMQDNINVTFNAQLAVDNTLLYGNGGQTTYPINFGPDPTDVFNWDGTNSSGRMVDNGVYTVQMIVKNADGYTYIQTKQVTVLNNGFNEMLGEVKIIPNPCVVNDAPGAGVNITWSNVWQGFVKVKIYNVAAELVRSYEADPSQQKITWDLHTPGGQTVSNGMYICVIEATNTTGGREVKFEKIGVIMKFKMPSNVPF